MIEAYAFLAVFSVQILAMSVLYPARLIKYVRARSADLPDEYFAHVLPGGDRHAATERLLTRYRAANTVIAVLGVLLWGWMFGYMRRPNWNEDPVVILLSVYFPMQMSPVVVLSIIGFRYRNVLRSLFSDGKRTAVLQRRGLFDFVSPITVFIAVASYLLFVTVVIYVQPDRSLGFFLIGVLTLTCALEAVVVYKQLYGKKNTPFETHAARVHAIGVTVKVSVYGCILCVAFFALMFTVDLLDQKRWVPFAMSVFLVITTFLCFLGFTAPPRRPKADGIGSGRRLAS